MKKILSISLFSLVILSACKGEPVDGQYAELAQCLSDKGVKMYGAFWCPHCANQKDMFGDDFRYIDYIECDERGENGDPEACREAGVQSYPTWTFPGQDPLVGEKSPEELAQKANCEVPGESMTTEEETPAEEEAMEDNTEETPAEESTES